MKFTDIIPGYRTDHSAIVFCFTASVNKRGKGYWKFNAQLLQDTEYINIVKNCIKETVQEYFVSGDCEDLMNVELSCNDQMFFEILKMKIRSVTISYSIKKSKERKLYFQELELEVKKLEQLVNTGSGVDHDHVHNLNEKKLELETARSSMIDGLILRSRVNWYEHGEKCSEYFCKLEKRNSVKKCINELINENGENVSDQFEILREEENFYRNLYTSKNVCHNDESFFNHNVKLTDEQKESCEGNITFQECSYALSKMKNGKSPGSDGFTVEFYKFFWRDIGPLLFRSLFFAYVSGSFSEFQRQGVITCLPKDGKDRRYMGNWRPISLLNTDLKVASAAIANRIKPVLPFIISDTQKGFMKNRFIGENTRFLYDVMHYLEDQGKTGLLLLIDFEKAFDSIEWGFLQKALASFNFGPSFCKWFDVLYSDAKSCVINNGFMSNFFNLSRGCRQGDPLSPYLFIIGVELLALKLKNNPDIQGIFIKDSVHLISQYADDTFMILDGGEISLKETLNCFDSFHKLSGLRMNNTKTRAVWIGDKKYSDHVICSDANMNWSCSNFRVLGLDFSLDLSKIVDLNFSKKIKDVGNILKSWEHRKLTLLGKITVVKSLALSKLVHLFTSLPDLRQVKVDELNTLFYRFIWSGKNDKIKRNSLIGDYTDGGLKMIHLSSFMSYLKVGWIKRFFENPLGSWQCILKANLEAFGEDRVFTFQRDKIQEIAQLVKNPFWKDVFVSYSLVKPIIRDCLKEVYSLDILNFVPIGEVFYYRRWEEKGIRFLKDLVDPAQKTFYSFSSMKDKLLTNNFLKYYSLLSNIPHYVKNVIKNSNENINFQNFVAEDNFLKSIIYSDPKFMYKKFLNLHFISPAEKFAKWEDVLNFSIDNLNDYFVILKKACKYPYLYSFQYKLLYRIIPTNSFLYKIHYKDTKYCTFCNRNDETIEHLFYDCNVVHSFWDDFFILVRKFDENIEISRCDIFLGSKTLSLFLNFLLIISKQYIFKCKLKEKSPQITELKARIKYFKTVDESIAKKNMKLEKHLRFWAPYQTMFL